MSSIDELKARRRRAVIEWAHAVTEDLLGESQRRAPVDEGNLRGSGEASVEVVGDRVEGTVSFSAVYAARQHEEITWHHPKGGEAKYVERPFRERKDRYLDALRNALERASR